MVLNNLLFLPFALLSLIFHLTPLSQLLLVLRADGIAILIHCLFAIDTTF